ncbi:50S ribosomal protein L32 [Akkermansiaceae bacterium]|jgi:large subunit ribosomal protein L32|nr:50S ribosomal protein L32 [bacterium]MBT4798359.1 50S ribosomal protein L32 [Verrucomicrobiota bacterium]MCH1420836.1 50S ribosomal protein L32 [Akkermansiaceae bacterium]MBT6166925.1 50S ribosomal protein L32 [Verrucomicrobiota bacterium]MBT6399977.1 50S ribosomal protein L32 [Verrucomicrobiota bacterium]
MASPKRRTSKHKQKLRRGANRWRKPLLKTCPECGTSIPGHIACPACGTYRDRQVVTDIDQI